MVRLRILMFVNPFGVAWGIYLCGCSYARET
jgi:hypothetical protein